MNSILYKNKIFYSNINNTGLGNSLNFKDYINLINYKNNMTYTKNDFIRILILFDKISNLSSYVYDFLYFRKILYFLIRPNIYCYKKGYNVNWNNKIGTIIKCNNYKNNLIKTTKSYNLFIRDKNDNNKRRYYIAKNINPKDCYLLWS